MKDNLAVLEEKLREEYEAKISAASKFHQAQLNSLDDANTKLGGEKKAFQWLLNRERERVEELENENAREKTKCIQLRAELEEIEEKFEELKKEFEEEKKKKGDSNNRYPLRKTVRNTFKTKL